MERGAYGVHVKLNDEEYKKLSDEYGEIVVLKIIDEINDYILSKGLKPYKDYAATIRNWLRKRQNQPMKYTNKSSSNEIILNKLKEKLKSFEDIEFGNDYILFKLGNGRTETINVKDHGFEEQIRNRLSKMLIKWPIT